jgi:zinc/manganese transport system permease protein
MIGTVFSWFLGVGILFVALAGASASGGESAITAANALFGSIFALTDHRAIPGSAILLAATLTLLAITRPLLFSSVDPAVAAGLGVSVRALGAVFLAMLAVISAQTVPAIGALLLIGLIAAPAGAAHHLTARPVLGLTLAAMIAVGAMWGGLAIAYTIPAVPPGRAVMLVAVGAYLAAGAHRTRSRPAALIQRRQRLNARTGVQAH